MSHASSLQGNGINFTLFHSLWNKSSHQNEKAKKSTKDEAENFRSHDNHDVIRIPDTIIFQFGQPLHWYFTSENRGQPTILRKRKQNLTVDKIEESFLAKGKREGLSLAKEEGNDIIAYFISANISEDSCASTSSHIEYFASNGLHNFLASGRKQRSGILQRFLQPQGPNNTLIRSIYTPKLCVLERRKNKLHIHDCRFGLYERAITFEGPEVHSVPSPLRGSVLASKIQFLCDKVVAHVQQVNIGGKIVRMVANWKIDVKGRIWLLYTTCLRVANSSRSKFAAFDLLKSKSSAQPSHLNIEQIVTLPHTIYLDQIPNHDKNKIVMNQIPSMTCPSCCKVELETKFYPIPYKTIIVHFEQVAALTWKNVESSDRFLHWPPSPNIIKTAGGVGFGMLKQVTGKGCEDFTIPPIIRHLHSRLKIHGYKRYRQDPLFLHKTCGVCERCFLAYALLSSTNFQIIEPIELDVHEKGEKRRKRKEKELQDKAREINSMWIPIDEDSITTNVNKNVTHGPKGKLEKDKDFGKIPDFPKAIVPVLEGGSVQNDYTLFTQDNVEERERKFFKEIALQGMHAIEGHALSHLLSTRETFDRIKNKMSNARNQVKENPYSEVIKLVDRPKKANIRENDKFKGKTKLPFPAKKSQLLPQYQLTKS